MKTITILNGPPGSGKSTIARGLEAILPNTKVLSFAAFPKEMTARALQFDAYELDLNKKDMPLHHFGLKTLRELYILFSEQVIKKIWNSAYIGYILAHDIINHRDNYDHFIISDGGFFAEIDALYEESHELFKLNIIQLHRYPKDFRNDSRRYISHPEIPITKVTNNGLIEDCIKHVASVINTK